MKCNPSNSGGAITPAPQRAVCDGQTDPPGTPHDSSKESIDKQASSPALPKDTFQNKARPAWLAAELNLTKKTEPPIRELSRQELEAAIKAMKKDIDANWGKLPAT